MNYDFLNYIFFAVLIAFIVINRKNKSLANEANASALLFPLTTLSSFLIWSLFPDVNNLIPKIFDFRNTFPFYLEAIMVFLILDLYFYLLHRLVHKFEFLYCDHFVHHAGENFNFHLSFRFSFISSFQILSPIPYLVFSMSVEATSIYVTAFIIIGMLTHCKSLKHDLGLLNYIFVNPYTHYVHHLDRKANEVKNFGFVLNIWDVVFSTFELPSKNSHAERIGVKNPERDELNPFVLCLLPYKRWLNSILKN